MAEQRVTRAVSRKAELARQALAGAGRILALAKFRFMGDTIVATPFLGQLRSLFPEAKIALLTSPSAAAALAGCPHVDSLLALETAGVSRWRHSRELLALLRQGRYDAVFLLNRSFHCAVMSARAGIPARIGYATDLRGPLLTVPVPYAFDRHEVECHLDLLRALGLPAQAQLPDLWISEEEQVQVAARLAERVGPPARPLIGVQPGANDAPIREWGAQRYAWVADRLIEETGGSVILMGGAAERETAAHMATAMRHPARNLAGELGLREALAAIGLCDLWLGNDTGLLHAAVAQRVASVGLFGPNKARRWGYDTPRHRSLVVVPDRPARDDTTVRRCLDAIAPDAVLEAAREVLGSPRRQPEEASYAVPASGSGTAPSPYFDADRAPALAPVRRR
ncbi:MAG TPA: lipopolysaccharide heptosyltransferase II [Chthonomonadaceae bacterium]|nr:lipopolysaccharide heptosyltransferase II [Chthonomonadaceae bacterium]